MKTDIHPKWYPEAKVTCVCGNSFTVGSIKESIHVEICSACHPFFTNQMKYVDTAGMVEKYEARKKMADPTLVKRKERKIQRRIEEDKADAARPKSLKEMFEKVKPAA
jgi:large subunit ribosomal protein L31